MQCTELPSGVIRQVGACTNEKGDEFILSYGSTALIVKLILRKNSDGIGRSIQPIHSSVSLMMC